MIAIPIRVGRGGEITVTGNDAIGDLENPKPNQKGARYPANISASIPVIEHLNLVEKGGRETGRNRIWRYWGN